MRLTQDQITALAQKMQNNGGIQTDAHHQYVLHHNHKNITIYGARNYKLVVPTPHLSDIHAILQLCHPNKHYYLTIGTTGCKIASSAFTIYSYGTKPSYLSCQKPLYERSGYYDLDLSSIRDIRIRPNDTMEQSSARMITHINNNVPFIDNNPDIFHTTNFLEVAQHIDTNGDGDVTFILNVASAEYSPDIRVYVDINRGRYNLSSDQFVLSLADKDQHTAIIHQHLQGMKRDAMRCDDEYLGTFVSRTSKRKKSTQKHIQQQLSPRDNQISRYIHRCVQILLDQYIYTPEQHTAKAA